MIYLNILGEHYVILNSLEDITELFEKRSSNYSDRKHMTMLIELYVSHSFHLREVLKDTDRRRMNWSMSMANMPYGQWWRRHRRLLHEYFYPNAVTKYQPTQRQEVRVFLHRLLVTPDDFLHHIRQ